MTPVALSEDIAVRVLTVRQPVPATWRDYSRSPEPAYEQDYEAGRIATSASFAGGLQGATPGPH